MADLNGSLSKYPVFKHFDSSQIVNKVNSFTPGQRNLFWIITAVIAVALAGSFWHYALPTIMVKLGQAIALVGTVIIYGALIILAPVIIKALKLFATALHKLLVESDPFTELAEQLKKMLQNQRDVRSSTGTIQGIQTDAEVEADKNEQDAKKLQSAILRLNDKAKSLKDKMDAMLKTGASVQGSDEYINTKIDFDKAVSESQRISFQLTQSKDFVQKYGSRAAIMKKTVQILKMVDAALDIKVLDFQATIEMLQKDYNFAEETKKATDKAKRALGIEKQIEVQWALDAVTATIASDIAITAGNLKDIDALTKNYTLDSDELYENLEVLSNNIRIGNDVVPEAKQYRNPEYKLTSDDKLKSGGFGDIF